MAKKQGQRLKILYILDFLKRESDEEHPVTAADICEYLDSQGIAAERKSVYADISALTDYGADIVRSGSPRDWFLASREFEEPEIYLLADAVRTAGFISAAKTRELVKKLDSFVSRYQAQKRENRVYFSSCAKSVNEEIFYSIDKISRAVTEKKKIRFEYVNRVLSPDRTIEKQKREMLISPYALTWQDDHYYVIGNYEKYDNLIHLRLDRMYKVEITDMPQRHFSEVSEYTDYFDTPDYTAKLFGMHGGEIYDIELKCSKKITEQVADRFGEDIFIKKVTDEDFCFTVRAALSDALVSWVISYGDRVKVLEPQILRDMVIGRTEKVLGLYNR